MKKPTQIASAIALVQLLQENPSLPPARWQIDTHLEGLRGHLHDDDATFEALTDYVHVIGGAVQPRENFTCGGEELSWYLLTTVWRDVTIEILAIMPRALSDAYIAEGRIAEQRHALIDLDSDSKFGPVDLGVAA